jgi:ApbE superfamily uncharacterized protein (UPF0280 family)
MDFDGPLLARKRAVLPQWGISDGENHVTDNRTAQYRKRVMPRDLVSFRVLIKETDLWVSVEQDLSDETEDIVFNLRHQIESYIGSHPEFLSTLKPYPSDPLAPPIIKEMIHWAEKVGVGPMASVAGAIAQETALGLLRFSRQVVVENGGDIYLKLNHSAQVAIHAGDSPLSRKFGLQFAPKVMPLGICTSSGTVGHSLSGGKADAVCVVSPSAYLADGAATALGNRIKSSADIEDGISWAKAISGILGGVVIIREKMAVWGDLELTRL